MAEQSSKTIYIKWVRSGIGFPRRQRAWIRSLGLKELNQVVERPDTPQIRGLVARAAHLVEIVGVIPARAPLAKPEYSVAPPEVAPKAVVPATQESSPAEEEEEVAAPTAASGEGEHSKATTDSASARKVKPVEDVKGKVDWPDKEAAGEGANAPEADRK